MTVLPVYLSQNLLHSFSVCKRIIEAASAITAPVTGSTLYLFHLIRSETGRRQMQTHRTASKV